MVGAQNAIKIASSFSPFKNRYSDTIMIERTMRSITKFIAPIFSIKFLIIITISVLLKDKDLKLSLL